LGALIRSPPAPVDHRRGSARTAPTAMSATN